MLHHHSDLSVEWELEVGTHTSHTSGVLFFSFLRRPYVLLPYVLLPYVLLLNTIVPVLKTRQSSRKMTLHLF